METADEIKAHEAELKALRDMLRAYGRRVAEHVTSLTLPDTPLELERTARMVRATDQMLMQVFAPPPPPPQPRELRSGGARPQGGRFRDDDDDDGEDENVEQTPEDQLAEGEQVMKMIRITTRRHAQATGFWPDGKPYDADDERTWEKDADGGLDTQPLAEVSIEAVQALLLRRFNDQTRYQAEQRNLWPDDTPYSADHAGYWSIFVGHQSGKRGPSKGETAGPWYMPDWIIRRSP